MVTLPQSTVLEHYVIDRVLGQGGFGVTYMAHDTTLERTVAIKEYFPQMWASRAGATVSAHPSAAKDYDWGLKSFIKEAKTLARFRHPCIVHVNRIIEANGTAYMVLGYEEGDDFGKWLEKLGRPPTQGELDAIADNLLDALAVVHRNGILHRDIAPDNIKIRRDGTPVLLDFGAAREAIGQRTGTISAIVKHGFSPVEQYSSTGRNQGPWTDIYALGATLYKAVTGKTPPEASDRAGDDELVPTHAAARGQFRPQFLAAIDHALRRNRTNRPQSVAEWRQALLGPPGSSPQETVLASPPPTDRRESAEAAKGRAVRATRWKWRAAAALAVGLAAAGYYLGVMRPAEQAQQQALLQTEEAERQRAVTAEARRSDDAAWTRAQRDDTAAALERYLTDHPQGRHVPEAMNRLTALKAAERRNREAEEAARKAAAESRQVERERRAEERRKQEEAEEAEARRKDDLAWRRAQRAGSTEAYEAYAAAYPDGAHVPEARKRIRELKGDDAAWEEAWRVNTAESLKRYLAAYPDGGRVGAAEAQLKKLQEKKVAVGIYPEKPEIGHAPKYKPGDEFQDCEACPKMVVVPAGEFLIGSPPSEKGRKPNEGPQRKVSITRPFAIGKFEVTFDQWDACVADGGCDGKKLSDNAWGRGRRPVVFASLDDAKSYVFWLRRKTGKQYRLPSEAEWEYAARAGTVGPYPFGSNESRLCDYGNIADEHLLLAWSVRCSDGAGERTTEVGRYLANGYGLHDMIGNVHEWVDDCWNENYSRLPADGAPARTGNCGFAVYRGGDWGSGAEDLRSAARKFYKFRRQGLPSIGFRVAVSLGD